METKREQEWLYLMPDKINFQSKLIIRDRGHYMVVQGSVYQGDITVVNMYVPNIFEAPK